MENWDIISKYLTNEATDAEKQELEAWLNADVANTTLFEEIKLSWDKVGVVADDDFDASKDWNSVQEKIKREDNIIPITGRKNSFKWVLRIAAVLTIALFSTWYALNADQKVVLLHAQTKDTPRLINLADGSKIWLNAHSNLTYPEKFDGDERTIILEGEAFFDVVRNPAQPFVVFNDNFTVKVLGTSFNISAYKEYRDVVVTVETGTVNFCGLIDQPVTLTKGEVGTLHKSNNSIDETINTNFNFLAWKSRKLKFNNESIKSVCDALKNYFAIDLIVEDKTIYNCKFTGSFDEPKLQDVLNTMEASLNIKVKTNQNRVTISGKGCE